MSQQITVVVVTFQGREFIRDCLSSLTDQTEECQILVVDNGSSDGTAEILASYRPPVRVLSLPTNVGFAGGLAAAFPEIDTPLLALLNDDAVADPHWLERLAQALDSHPDSAAVTSEMWLSSDSDGNSRINNLGVALTAHGYGYDVGLGQDLSGAFETITEVFGFSGGAALLKVEILRAVGGVPAHYFLYYEDVDMSWRLRLAGHRIHSVPGAIVHHRHSATAGQHSEMFHRFNERNRLLTMWRCAPLQTAAGETFLFGLTTISLVVKRILRRRIPDAANFRIRLRLGVLQEVVSRFPASKTERHAVHQRSSLSRSQVAREWLGSPAPTGSVPR